MPKKIRHTTKEYITYAKLKHGDKYDYSCVKYNTAHDLVSVVCPSHGTFKIQANSHLQGFGCKKCSNIERATPMFIKKAKKIHKNQYDYSHVTCERVSDKVKIICPVHGEFLQVASTHLRGSGCQKCANEKRSAEGLYCESYFSKENKNLVGVFYVIELWNNDERFIKIGITKNDIKSRFGSKLPYETKVINVQHMSLKDAYNKEQKILTEMCEFKYTPKQKFTGYTECLDLKAKGILNNE